MISARAKKLEALEVENPISIERFSGSPSKATAAPQAASTTSGQPCLRTALISVGVVALLGLLGGGGYVGVTALRGTSSQSSSSSSTSSGGSQQLGLDTGTVGISVKCVNANSGLKPLPNSNYVGVGYDILKGDPFAKTVDPGYTADHVFDTMNYCEGATTQDGTWALADGLESLSSASSNIEQGGDHMISTGETSLSNNMKTDMSVGFGWGSLFAFKASAGFSKESSNIKDTTNDNVSFYSKAVVTLHKVMLSPYTAKLANGFQIGVRQLPLDNSTASINQYLQFIDTYGTHYVTSVLLGARYGHISESTVSKLKNFQSTGKSWQVGLSATITTTFLPPISPGISTGNSNTQQTVSEWQNTVTSESNFFIGSTSVDVWKADGLSVWQAGIAANPMPVGGSVSLISNLFTSLYFPNDPNISIKAKLFAKALDARCASLVNVCVPYLPDKSIDFNTQPSTIPTTSPVFYQQYLKMMAHELVVDNYHGTVSNGNTIQMYSLNGGLNSQQWIRTSCGQFQLFGTGKCLDTQGITTDNHPVVLWDCNCAQGSQKFERVSCGANGVAYKVAGVQVCLQGGNNNGDKLVVAQCLNICGVQPANQMFVDVIFGHA